MALADADAARLVDGPDLLFLGEVVAGLERFGARFVLRDEILGCFEAELEVGVSAAYPHVDGVVREVDEERVSSVALDEPDRLVRQPCG